MAVSGVQISHGWLNLTSSIVLQLDGYGGSKTVRAVVFSSPFSISKLRAHSGE
jgi:hypothetical protein